MKRLGCQVRGDTWSIVKPHPPTPEPKPWDGKVYVWDYPGIVPLRQSNGSAPKLRHVPVHLGAHIETTLKYDDESNNTYWITPLGYVLTPDDIHAEPVNVDVFEVIDPDDSTKRINVVSGWFWYEGDIIKAFLKQGIGRRTSSSFLSCKDDFLLGMSTWSKYGVPSLASLPSADPKLMTTSARTEASYAFTFSPHNKVGISEILCRDDFFHIWIKDTSGYVRAIPRIGKSLSGSGYAAQRRPLGYTTNLTELPTDADKEPGFGQGLNGCIEIEGDFRSYEIVDIFINYDEVVSSFIAKINLTNDEVIYLDIQRYGLFYGEYNCKQIIIPPGVLEKEGVYDSGIIVTAKTPPTLRKDIVIEIIKGYLIGSYGETYATDIPPILNPLDYYRDYPIKHWTEHPDIEQVEALDISSQVLIKF